MASPEERIAALERRNRKLSGQAAPTSWLANVMEPFYRAVNAAKRKARRGSF